MIENPTEHNQMQPAELDYRNWWNSLTNPRREILNQVADQPEQAHQIIETWPISPHFFKDMFTAFALGDNTPRLAVFNFFDQAGREINNERSRRRSSYRINYIQGLEPFLSEHTHPFTQTRPAISTMNPDFASTKLLTWTTNIFDPSRSVNMRIREFNDLFLYDLKRYYQHNRNAFDFIDLAVTDFRQMLNLYRLEPNRPSWSERIRNFFFETTPATSASPHETVTITPADTEHETRLVITYEDLGLSNRQPHRQSPISFTQAVKTDVESAIETPVTTPPEEWLNFGLSPSSRAEFSPNKISLVENDPPGVEEIVVSFEFRPYANTINIAFDKELDDHHSLVSLEVSVDHQGVITHSLTPDQIHLLQTYGVFYRLQGLQGKCLYTQRYNQTFQQLQQPLINFGESLSSQLEITRR